MIKKRVDGNQKAIIDALKKHDDSLSYCLLHTVGKGVPDLLIGFKTKNGSSSVLVEIKNKSGKLNQLQVQFFKDWKGPIIKVKSLEEIIEWLEKNEWDKGVENG